MLFIFGNSFINVVDVTYPDGEWKRYNWIPGWIPKKGGLFSDLKGTWIISKVETWGWDYFEIKVIPYTEEDYYDFDS